MSGYSGTPLPQKLGIKQGVTLVTVNAQANYRRLLGTIPKGVTFSDRLEPDLPTDVTEDVVRAVALPLGFVDVKVCAIDEIWSGLKLVVRRKERNRHQHK